jgi:hypothetical protein
MFFASRKRDKSQRGVSRSSDPAGKQDENRQSQQWQTWRRSARDVTRACNEWLAAGRCERATFYAGYVSALVEEGRAATELERSVKLAASTPPASRGVAPAAHGMTRS